jgi:hypothetical protein
VSEKYMEILLSIKFKQRAAFSDLKKHVQIFGHSKPNQI